MKFELMELPFERDALEPFLSARTLEFHHDKHHAGYLKKLDNALEGGLRDLPLEEIIRTTEGPTYNLAAQVWNHDFYWRSLAVESQQPKDPVLISKLKAAFGGLEGFRETFAEAAGGEFGSGWTWLLLDPESSQLSIDSTTDAVNPMSDGLIPLLTLDVWEHAYYLDYQNRRPDYIDAFLQGHLNWRFVEENLTDAMADIEPEARSA